MPRLRLRSELGALSRCRTLRATLLRRYRYRYRQSSISAAAFAFSVSPWEKTEAGLTAKNKNSRCFNSEKNKKLI